MKTTAENRCAGEGKGRKKIAEASARFMSKYGFKPGGGETRADSRAVCQNGSVAYELFMSTKAIYFGFAEQENVLCCLWFTNNRYI
jgi:hypothetical protein